MAEGERAAGIADEEGERAVLIAEIKRSLMKMRVMVWVLAALLLLSIAAISFFHIVSVNEVVSECNEVVNETVTLCTKSINASYEQGLGQGRINGYQEAFDSNWYLYFRNNKSLFISFENDTEEFQVEYYFEQPRYNTTYFARGTWLCNKMVCIVVKDISDWWE